MSNPFDVPERALPEHVRQAALRRIMTEIGDARPRRRKGLAPVLIAASVIALMAGATIVASTLASNKDSKVLNASPTTGATTTSSSGSYSLYNAVTYWVDDAQLQRCWAAGHKPDNWLPLLRVERNGLTAYLYRTDSDLGFCELTKEQVTVKTLPYPNPPTGNTPAKIMFTTAQGTYAGVVAPGVHNLTVGPGGALPEPAAVNSDVFILPNSSRQTDQMYLGDDAIGYPGNPVPKADLPQPLAATRTGADPKADRTSAAGLRLKACLTAASPPMVDADWWQPGAYLSVDSKHAVQLGILDGRVMACQQDEDVVTVDGPLGFTFVGGGTEITAKLSGSNLSPPGEYFVGHVVDAKAKTATLSVEGAADVTGTIVNNTVVLYRPQPPTRTLQGKVLVRDAAGAVIDQIGIHN